MSTTNCLNADQHESDSNPFVSEYRWVVTTLVNNGAFKAASATKSLAYFVFKLGKLSGTIPIQVIIDPPRSAATTKAKTSHFIPCLYSKAFYWTMAQPQVQGIRTISRTLFLGWSTNKRYSKTHLCRLVYSSEGSMSVR